MGKAEDGKAWRDKYKLENGEPHYAQRANTNRLYLRQLKLEKGCVDCGYNKHYAALDWDHLSLKTFSISKKYHYALKTILKELENCEVVCANCHRIRTEIRRLAND